MRLKITSKREAPVEKLGKGKRASLSAGETSLTYESHDRIESLAYLDVGSVRPTKGYRWHGLVITSIDSSMKPLIINGLTADDASRMFRHIRQKLGDVWSDHLAPLFSRAYDDLTDTCENGYYVDNRTCIEWQDKYGNIKDELPTYYKEILIRDGVADYVNRVLSLLSDKNLRQYINQVNDRFITVEKERWQQFFDVVESNPLTEQQRDAIITDEVNNLIIAGAGTGKTSTLMGKVGYLLEKGIAKPDEILLLSFTSKAAGELAERIKEKFDTDLTVSTFHKLGLHILGSEGSKPSISKLAQDANELHKFIETVIREMMSDREYSRKLIQFFTEYLVPFKDQFAMSDMGEYIAYLKNNDIRTLQGDRVKSYEEVQIANFLILNGIPFEYERKYEHDVSTTDYSQYKPDFYLTRDNIYIEHFALDAKGMPPDFMGTDGQQRYLDGVKWKRETHSNYGTKLIETYSRDASDGVLQEKLQSLLEAEGVQFTPMTDEEFFKQDNSSTLITRLTALLARFLVLFKSQNTTVETLRQKTGKGYDGKRLNAFLDIFSKVSKRYEDHLHEEGDIDFNDMINKACELVRNKKYQSPYKYILIDEFQDISWVQYQLVKALIEQRDDVKTVCVGDDWQSIYRFTGADVSIMTGFADYFGNTATSKLEDTFRFSQSLVEFSTKFIMKNRAQIKKNLVSWVKDFPDSVKVILTDSINSRKELACILHEIAGEVIRYASVFILGRYKHDEPDELSELKEQHIDLKISYHTAHSSKGLQADYVILTNVGAGRYGFPSEVSDDPILDLVMVRPDTYPNAEERRLFYVAVTRAKKRVYILADYENKSPFVTEITRKEYGITVVQPDGIQSPVACPKCKTGILVERQGEYGRFIGCTNFPYCDEKAQLCRECGAGVMLQIENESYYGCQNEACGIVVPACPDCGNILVVRDGKYGKFYGCSKYSQGCSFTRDIDL